MSGRFLTLRHLCFTGPDRSPAALDFEPGLNVLYGASETGKSFVLESIDFMLGGRGPLRDIPERIGYDRIFLGLEAAGERFTAVRSTEGGRFTLFKGLHRSVPEDQEGVELAAKHSGSTADNLSYFLLEKIGLSDKRVKTNSRGGTRTMSFRNVCRFCLVSEGDIQKQGSPIESGRPTDRTPEYATFKLLLTGVDDSALVPDMRESPATHSRAGKMELLDELLGSYEERLPEGGADAEQLAAELRDLDAVLEREERALSTSDEALKQLSKRRSDTAEQLGVGEERRGEVEGLLARFKLLDDHYSTDLVRLEGIQEAGSLMAALSQSTCPLCGADPDGQHVDADCDGNLEAVVTAARAESAKIDLLRRELRDTMEQLGLEREHFDSLLPGLRERLEKLDAEVRALRPELAGHRRRYAEILDNRTARRAVLALLEQAAELRARRDALEREAPSSTASAASPEGLSATTLDQFAQEVEFLLRSWNFPDATRIHFAERDRDLVIGGKRRGSRGKGMRAITHAAFTVGLLEHCRKQQLAHPGFVLLDSPLLAYRAPEGTEDDLRGTDVQERFYEYLVSWQDRQAIVIENVDPPASVRVHPTTTFFGGPNRHDERPGFFPRVD